MAASIVGIFTFAYAVLLGLYINAQWGTRAVKESPKEMQLFCGNLVTSFREIEEVGTGILREAERRDEAYSHKLHAVLEKGAMADLRHLVIKFHGVAYSSRLKQWWYRAQYILQQEELEKKL